MRVPPSLLSLSVLFWGVESGNIIIGALIALLCGSVAVVRTRWRFTEHDFARISDLTSVVFLACIALVLLNAEPARFIKTVVIWLPPVLAPLILAQLYTDSEKIIIGTHLGFRRKTLYKHNPIDFRIHYLFIVLLASAVANSRSAVYFPVTVALLGLVLFVNRGRAAPVWLFAMLCIGAGVAGSKSSGSLEQLHQFFRDKTRLLIRGYVTSLHTDPFLSHLTFGDIGRLKTSGKILLRLETAGENPQLLRLASYESYSKNSWHSSKEFDYLPVTNLGWDLLPSPHVEGKSVAIEYYLPKKKGLLPHPYGSYRVEGDTLYELDQKPDGITRVIDGADLVTYEVRYNREQARVADQPGSRDLRVNREEAELFGQVAESIGRAGLTEFERLEAVEEYFADGFTYSLERTGPGSFASELENFLVGDRTGYCELFATATTLLLRELGLPSRYVTGFAVSEYSELEKKYLVRQRHAHAWSEVYVGGRWVVVDTTPDGWFQNDADNRGRLEPLRDLLSLVRLHYDQFRLQVGEDYRLMLSIAVVGLSALLAYSIYRRMKVREKSQRIVLRRKTFRPVDSPFYVVEKKVALLGVPRFADEPFPVWIDRIMTLNDGDRAILMELYSLHRKLRYDPEGLDEKESGLLDTKAAQFAAELEWRSAGKRREGGQHR